VSSTFLDKHLATHEYLAGSDYTIADIAVWPWFGGMVRGLLYKAAEFLSVHEYTHVVRWANTIAERSGRYAGSDGNKTRAILRWLLRERHDASDFDKLAARSPSSLTIMSVSIDAPESQPTMA